MLGFLASSLKRRVRIVGELFWTVCIADCNRSIFGELSWTLFDVFGLLVNCLGAFVLVIAIARCVGESSKRLCW